MSTEQKPLDLEAILANCGCGMDHMTGNTGGCDVPALAAEVKRLRGSPNIPERLLYELRAIHRALAPNLGGSPDPIGVDRARSRAHGLIMEFGRGEFFT